MKIVVLVVSVILFFLLTPGVLLRLPNKGSIYIVAGVHSLVFGLLLWLLSKFVLKSNIEGLGPAASDFNNVIKSKYTLTDGDNQNVKIFKNSISIDPYVTQVIDALKAAPNFGSEMVIKTNTKYPTNIFGATLNLTPKDYVDKLTDKINSLQSTASPPPKQESNVVAASMPTSGGGGFTNTNTSATGNIFIPTNTTNAAISLEQRLTNLEAKLGLR